MVRDVVYSNASQFNCAGEGALNRGSEWSRWDLHLHSPYTRLANNYDGDWDGFLNAIVSSKLTVVGITNYFCFAEGELERVRDGLSALGSSTVALGNLEFRLSQPNKDGTQINAHALFAEHLTTPEILEGISRIKLMNSAPSGRQLHCCEADFGSGHINYESAVVEFHELLEQLKASFDRRDFVVALCPSGYGAFRPAQGEGRGNALAREFDQRSDLMFGREKDREFFLNEARYEDARAKAVFWNSDAHGVPDIGTKVTWVRARPGMEGLKQALYEPDIRVDISGAARSQEDVKPCFQQFLLGGEIVEQDGLAFASTAIPVNSGLVALIGGRGTGKSVLLDSLFKCTHTRSDQLDGLTALSVEAFAADFQKQGTSNSLVRVDSANSGGITYLHVRQGDVRRIAEDSEALSEEIRNLLGLRHDESDQSSSVIRSLLGEIEAVESWFKEEDENGNFVNSKELNARIINENKQRIATISSEENRQLVVDYEAAVAISSSLSRAIDQIDAISTRISALEQDVKQSLLSALDGIDGIEAFDLTFADQVTRLSGLMNLLVIRRTSAVEKINELRTSLRDRGIELDPEGLLDKIGLFKSEMLAAEARLKEFELNSKKLMDLRQRRVAHSQQIVDDILRQQEEIDQAFSLLKAGKSGWTVEQASLVQQLLADVAVQGDVWLDAAAFYEGLARSLDYRKFRVSGERVGHTARLQPRIGVEDIEDFRALLRNERVIKMQDDSAPIALEEFLDQEALFIEGGRRSALEWFFIPSNIRRYIKARARITYKGKEPRRLSVGQRGTFYLCMKLATDPFGSPFVFDQPEDDLDNEFIVNELVPLFRSIKRYRQMIVATHNANLVVNADADQVLVASNVDDKLMYSAGAIEDVWVRDKICTILEGGRDAFLRRELKYGFTLVDPGLSDAAGSS